MAETQLAGFPVTAAQGIFQESSSQLHDLGAYMETTDGRGFRYAKVGVTATVAGKVYASATEDTTNQTPSGGLTPAANVAIGATSITISDTLTLAANKLAGGYMSIVITPGQGYLYRIKSNTAVTAAANMVITLEDPLQIAITTASNLIVTPHPYDSVVIAAGTLASMPVGVAQDIITGAYYGWLQVRGVASVLFTGTGVTGYAVGSLTSGTAGSLAPSIAGVNILGYQVSVGISGEYSLIYLTLG